MFLISEQLSLILFLYLFLISGNFIQIFFISVNFLRMFLFFDIPSLIFLHKKISVPYSIVGMGIVQHIVLCVLKVAMIFQLCKVRKVQRFVNTSWILKYEGTGGLLDLLSQLKTTKFWTYNICQDRRQVRVFLSLKFGQHFIWVGRSDMEYGCPQL